MAFRAPGMPSPPPATSRGHVRDWGCSCVTLCFPRHCPSCPYWACGTQRPGSRCLGTGRRWMSHTGHTSCPLPSGAGGPTRPWMACGAQLPPEGGRACPPGPCAAPHHHGHRARSCRGGSRPVNRSQGASASTAPSTCSSSPSLTSLSGPGCRGGPASAVLCQGLPWTLRGCKGAQPVLGIRLEARWEGLAQASGDRGLRQAAAWLRVALTTQPRVCAAGQGVLRHGRFPHHRRARLRRCRLCPERRVSTRERHRLSWPDLPRPSPESHQETQPPTRGDPHHARDPGQMSDSEPLKTANLQELCKPDALFMVSTMNG